MQGLDKIKDSLINLSEEYKRLCELLSYEEILADKKLSLNYDKRKQSIESVVLKFQEYNNECEILDELEILKTQANIEERQIFEDEKKLTILKIKNLEREINKLYIQLNNIMQNIFIEVVKGKDETTKLFKDLICGYTKFCENNGLNYSVEEIGENAKINIQGLNAKEYFKGEIGLHSVKNNSSTACCKVFVYEATKDTFFDEKDLSIITCRSSGAGGQHINTTDSAIKATHLLTGISAVCQDERSQFQNKQKAIERVKEKVLNFYESQKNTMIENQKKLQLKSFKKNQFVKIYDYKKGLIFCENNEFSINDFLQGKVI